MWIVTDYQFGREVTIKLPEPNRRDEKSVYWHLDQIGGVKIHEVDNVIYVAYPLVPRHEKDLLTAEQHKRFALILLAAADYAERGDSDD
jgi:hypothetical protein